MARATQKTEIDSMLLNFGATATDLAQIFDVPSKRVTQRLAGRVSPMTAAGDPTPRWHIKDAAKYLVEPKVDVEQFLRTLSPNKLPPKLQDAFWAAQNRRMDVEERIGELWSTARVMEFFADLFKPMRMQILMMADSVAQETELSPRQREIIIGIADTLMAHLKESLIDKVEGYTAPDDEHGRPIDEIANAAEVALEDAPRRGRPSKTETDEAVDAKYVDAPVYTNDNEEFDDGFGE